MPIIGCTHCRSRFKVPVATVGKDVRCPKCRREFHAMALHSTPRASHGLPPVAYLGIILGALAIGFLVVMGIVRSRETPPPEPVDKATTAAPASSTGPKVRLTPEQALQERARELLEAMRLEGDADLPGWIDYPRMYEEERREGGAGEPWTSLSEAERYEVRERLLAAVLGDEAQREFSRQSAVEQLRIEPGREGVVLANLKNAVTTREQQVTLHLTGSAGNWKLFRVERSALAQPEVADSRPEPPPLVLRSRNPEGVVEEVPLVEGTSPTVASDLNKAISLLTNPKATTEAGAAREKLVAAGKPAIPYLLNALVPLDFAKPDDLIVASRVSQALIDLTGQSYPILPGGNVGSMLGEFAADNEPNRRRWFGWWRDHQDSYTGPPKPTFEEDGDEGM